MKPVIIITIAFVLLFALIPTTSLAFGESIPSWVKNIFVWYAEDKIEEDELLSALQYLVNSKIITSDGKQIVRDNITSIFAHTIKDNGDFYVTYEENPNSNYELSVKDMFQEAEWFEHDIQYLNSNFKLPYDVEIVVKECNTPNAFYNHQTKQIIMCYEFVERVNSDYVTYYGKQSLVNEHGIFIADENFLLSDVTYWVFYHEVGHALSSIYGLPYTGLRENVADQFASYVILVETEFDGEEKTNYIQDMMVNVGTWFFILDNSGQEHIFWDTHNLSIQRFYNISCYVYGNNPQYTSWLVTDEWLPQKRADSCAYEYSVLEDSWTRLLAPYRIG